MFRSRFLSVMFEFKKFKVDDTHCGMKVGTDGVLLGAWANICPGDSVWDVGAGSGLISLMAAQRGAGHVTAFEVDAGASMDARGNIAASAWNGRIEVIEGDFAVKAADACFLPDVIVSNPPFFTETIHSPGKARAQARHEDSLPVQVIIQIAAGCLKADGRFAIIAPMSRMEEIQFEARLARLWLVRMVTVTTVSGKSPKRFLAEWSVTRPERRAEISELAIRDSSGRYTDEYRKLTGEFYL